MARPTEPPTEPPNPGPKPPAAESSNHADARSSPLSLSRLREAFAAMLGGPPAKSAGPEKPSRESRQGPPRKPPAPRACEISPRTVVEAILFVGRPDNGPISARELAAAMRGVSPSEIDSAVVELNNLYTADEVPYHVEKSPGGYRLVLRPEFERVRDKFYGKIKEARLTPAVLEVLSILAYNQPATAGQLSEIRGEPCGAALATLVRRKLVRLDRPTSQPGPPQYATTDRFLQLFGLDSLDALPRSEELEKV